MQTKWNPIVNGNMKGVPRDEEVIFTVLDEDTGEVRTASGQVDEYFLKKRGHVFVGTPRYPVDNTTIKAWMELPEPYVPGRCDVCKHNEHWTDCFGDRWSKCKFSERQFVKGCSIEKEVINHGSN